MKSYKQQLSAYLVPRILLMWFYLILKQLSEKEIVISFCRKENGGSREVQFTELAGSRTGICIQVCDLQTPCPIHDTTNVYIK